MGVTGNTTSAQANCPHNNITSIDAYMAYVYITCMRLIQLDCTGFLWDNGNRNKNFLKHHVSNGECEEIFFNQPLLIINDNKHSQNEIRYSAFGKTDSCRLLTIIYTVRGELIRVISARDMSRKERKYYEKNS